MKIWKTVKFLVQYIVLIKSIGLEAICLLQILALPLIAPSFLICKGGQLHGVIMYVVKYIVYIYHMRSKLIAKEMLAIIEVYNNWEADFFTVIMLTQYHQC